ncbi:MAG: F0F1 ATP synthase subunit delta [Anaerolineae bacterium]
MLLELDIATIILEIVNFVVLSALLYYFLFRPVLKRVEERAAEKERLLNEAAQEREEAIEMRAEIEEQMENIDRQIARIVDDAREQIQDEREAILEEVRHAAERMIIQARREAERIQEAELASVRDNLLATLADACTQIIGQVTPKEVHHSLVEQLTARVWEMGRKDMEQVEALRRSLGERTPTAYAVSARALSEEEQRELVRTFSAVADRNVTVDMEVDPSLAAGLRVRIGDMVVDNSLAKQVSELHGEIAEALEDIVRD